MDDLLSIFYKRHSWIPKDKPIVVEYSAPEWINSAEAGFIVNNNVDYRDIISLIYQRAANWIISINGGEKIVLKKEIINPEFNTDFESSIFKKIFPNSKTEKEITKNTNMYNLCSISTIYKHVNEKWRSKGEKEHTLIKFIPLIFWIALLIYIVLTQDTLMLWIPIPLIILELIFIKADTENGHTYKRIILTEEWLELKRKILWFKKFIESCDINRIKYFLEKDPLYVDKIIPYATAFGLETKFIKKLTPLIQNIEILQTKWRSDNHVFQAYDKTFITTFSRSVNSAPKFKSTWTSKYNSGRGNYWWGGRWSSYSSDWWFSSWSSFGHSSWWSSHWGGFSHWGGGWWWGSRSW